MVIFLRGAVPPKNEHPEKLLYKKIEECEDMWTQLFHEFLKQSGEKGELWYQGKKRVFEVDNIMTERWLPSFKNIPLSSIHTKLLICRGGFPYYDSVCKLLRPAKKVYYGAGRRFLPQHEFKDFDLVLVDTTKQYIKAKSKGYKTAIIGKPAASLFVPHDIEKKYDVCFMANATQKRIKRHAFMIKSLADTGLKILALGNQAPELRRLATKRNLCITWKPWMLRKRLPRLISQCKVGLCCSNEIDSAPRVISEYMACGLPVVVTETVRVHPECLYGVTVKDADIVKGIKKAMTMEDAREFYEDGQSLSNIAARLRSLILGPFGICE